MADRNEALKARLLATFRVEAQEHLQAILAHLLNLEHGLPLTESRQVMEAVFREVHTLKGAARSVSLLDVEALCQALESVLRRITQGHLAPSRPLLHGVREVVDGVAHLLAGGETPAAVRQALIDRLEHAASAGGDEGQGVLLESLAPATQPLPPIPHANTIRLATARLDTLLLQAEDFLGLKLAAAERVRETQALVEALTDCGIAMQPPPPALATALQGAAVHARELLRHLVRDQRTITTAVDGLQETMRRLRMTPASAILNLFPPMVRDLAGEQGKEVEWQARGSELEVDRKILEAIKDPLIHLVRNAIDHGIEPPATRHQSGKARQGQVAVTIAALEGNRLEIRVVDDGCGVDLAQVRAAAVRTRVFTPEEAQALTDGEALNLIYRSGLSTSPIITDISGHGLGLAIVKERVEGLGGQLYTETEARVGTTVRMVLPASIATFRGLLVRAGGQLFLLPLVAVKRAIRLVAAELERVKGHAAIRWDGHPLPIARLSQLLGLPPQTDQTAAGSRELCVVIRSGEEQVGLLVEEILGDREGLVKMFGSPLIRVRNVSGAVLLGSGQVVLILRPQDLLKSVRRLPRSRAPAAAPEEPGRPPVILVVDDSITTRTMEKNLLEMAGYRVRVAVDGVEAWALLKSEAFDLVVSDVDMPRLDGCELTARIRADRQLADLPVVLVTALESRQDKERGMEMGANAYVVKSSFDQSNLLEIIRRLL